MNGAVAGLGVPRNNLNDARPRGAAAGGAGGGGVELDANIVAQVQMAL